jgi:hypothetical protein
MINLTLPGAAPSKCTANFAKRSHFFGITPFVISVFDGFENEPTAEWSAVRRQCENITI